MTIQKLTKVGLVSIASAGAALGILAGPAQAGGFGNTTNNCYGQYFNTAWNQQCSSKGAAATGFYNSTADCTSSPDKSLSKYRTKGSGGTVSGSDCRFQVVNVRTSFSS